MNDRTARKMPKWPFFAGDAMLLGVACFIFWQSKLPLGHWEMAACAACVALGAVLGVAPHVLEYRAAMALTEADRLKTAVLQIQNLEIIGRQIANATANWQNIQEASAKTVDSARQISESVASTAGSFSEFIQKADDAEKNHLRLEVEKLHRAENDWLQILVRILDHVFALYQAGVRSGQPSLVEQLGNFQNACRDAARRVGLTPFAATAGEPFDPKLHQMADSTVTPTTESRVAETVAAGYSFQGQLVRPALVTVHKLEIHKQQDAGDLSLSMISRRHSQAHTVQESPQTASQPDATGTEPGGETAEMPDEPTTEPSDPAQEIAQAQSDDSERERLRP